MMSLFQRYQQADVRPFCDVERPTLPLSPPGATGTRTWTQEGTEQARLNLCDWTLTVKADAAAAEDHTTVWVHRSVVGVGERASHRLRERFLAAEGSTGTVALSVPDPCVAVFAQALDFMYGGTLDPEPGDLVPLLELAHLLFIPALEHALRRLIPSLVDEASAFECLGLGLELGHPEVANFAGFVVATQFGQIDHALLHRLPFATLLALLHQHELGVSSEDEVLAAVVGVLQAREMEEEQVRELASTVRFPFVSLDAVIELVDHELLPPDITEVAMRAIHCQSNDGHEAMLAWAAGQSQPLPFDVELREAYEGVRCPLYGGVGVLQHLATDGGEREWRNPMEAGLVEVTWSARCRAMFPTSPKDVVGQRGVYCGTSGSPHSWIQLDVGEGRAVELAAYMVRRGGVALNKASHLGDWQLEGSNDASTWAVLQAHVNDWTLSNRPFAEDTWVLDDPPENAYRYFRIRKTGRDRTDFLMLSGWELYGQLKTQ